MPPKTDSAKSYKALHVQLTILSDELSAQARPRPLVVAPPATTRLVRTLLAKTRHLLHNHPTAKTLPTLSRTDAPPLGVLALTLGQARAALETFGTEKGFDQQSHPQNDQRMQQLREILTRRLEEMQTEND